MDEMTCPRCQATMTRRGFAQASVSQCEGCGGLFLERAELGSLVEAETDWHAHRSSSTQPMPRITADMAEPPPARPRARSFIDALFKLGG